MLLIFAYMAKRLLCSKPTGCLGSEKSIIFGDQAVITLPEAAIFPCRFSISNSSELQNEELTRTIDHTGRGKISLSEAFGLMKKSKEKIFIEKKQKGLV